jgi:hypothetical protein
MTHLLAEPVALHAFTQVGAACWPPGSPGNMPGASLRCVPGFQAGGPSNG